MIKYNPYNWEIKNNDIVEDAKRLVTDENEVAVKNFLDNLLKRIDCKSTRYSSMTIDDRGMSLEILFKFYK